MSLPVALLALSDGDRAELGRLLAAGDSRLAERARIVLACAEPSAGGNSGVAQDRGWPRIPCGSGASGSRR